MSACFLEAQWIIAEDVDITSLTDRRLRCQGAEPNPTANMRNPSTMATPTCKEPINERMNATVDITLSDFNAPSSEDQKHAFICQSYMLMFHRPLCGLWKNVNKFSYTTWLYNECLAIKNIAINRLAIRKRLCSKVHLKCHWCFLRTVVLSSN